MSHSVRFLALAIAAWAGVRAITLGLDPGRDALAATLDDSQLSEAAQGPTAPASATPPPAPGMQVSQPAYGALPYGYGAPPYGWQPYYQPQWLPAQAPPPTVIRLVQAAAPQQAMPAPTYYPPYYASAGMAAPSSIPPLALPQPDGVLLPPRPHSTPPIELHSASEPKRLRGYGYAFYRQEGTRSAPTLAPVGTLGGSQTASRIFYRLAPRLDASFRHYGAFGDYAGSEAALGLRYQPFSNVPLAITAERRQRISGFGRSDFSVFGEYGAYEVKLPSGFTADGFAQAGIVGLTDPDWFVDAQLSATRPVWDGIEAGAGIWTSAQPGVHRVDAGPRLSVPIGKRLNVIADYRFNLAGNAQPSTGAAVTVAADF